MTPQTPYSPAEPFTLDRMAPPNRRRWVPLAVAGLVLALGAGGFAAYALTRDEPAPVDKTAALIAACRDEAKKQLKAPATAQFSEEKPVDQGDRFYYISGAIDAQNSFGALVRNRYLCKAESTDSGWSVVRVELSD